MTRDPTKEHPDYGKIQGIAQYAAEHFEEATELDEAAVNPAADVESNELKVSGQVCGRCGQPIDAGSDVRRRGNDGYVHEVCPLHVTASG